MMGRNPLQTFLACKVNFKSNLLSQFDFLSLIRQIKLQIAQNQVPLSDIFLYCTEKEHQKIRTIASVGKVSDFL